MVGVKVDEEGGDDEAESEGYGVDDPDEGGLDQCHLVGWMLSSLESLL